MDTNTFSVEGSVTALRVSLKGLAATLLEMKQMVGNTDVLESEDRGEVMANLTLSYRHLEDASMRLGKVLQARDGGISIYDKDSTIGAPTE